MNKYANVRLARIERQQDRMQKQLLEQSKTIKNLQKQVDILQRNQNITKLYEEGYTQNAIAMQLGMSQSSVSHILKAEFLN